MGGSRGRHTIHWYYLSYCRWITSWKHSTHLIALLCILLLELVKFQQSWNTRFWTRSLLPSSCTQLHTQIMVHQTLKACTPTAIEPRIGTFSRQLLESLIVPVHVQVLCFELVKRRSRASVQGAGACAGCRWGRPPSTAAGTAHTCS